MAFRNGTRVRVGSGRGIPKRYAGRTGTVVNSRRTARGTQVNVSFGARRANPLPVRSSLVKAIE